MTNDNSSHDSTGFFKLKAIGSGAAALSSVVGILYQDPVTIGMAVGIVSMINVVEAQLDFSG